MKKIIFLSLILMLCLTACKEKEPDNNDVTINEDGTGENNNTGENEDESGYGDIVIEDGKEDETGKDNSGKEDDFEYITEGEPEVIQAELWMETEKNYHYVQGGELKDVSCANHVSTAINYNGTEYAIEFAYEFVNDEFQCSTNYTEEYSYSVRQIVQRQDKVLISVYVGHTSLFYIYDIATDVMTQICTEDFWTGKYIEDVKIGADASSMIVGSEGEIYYCNGEDIRTIGSMVKQLCPELDYYHAVFLEDKIIILAEIHSSDLTEGVKISYYSYNPETGELLCTGDKLPIAEWERASYRFYYNVNAIGKVQITNILDGRTKVIEVSTANTNIECRYYDMTYLLVPLNSGQIQVVNMYTGRSICRIDLGIKLESHNQWYVLKSDEGLYLQVGDSQYDDKVVWKCFKIEIE